LRAGGEPKFSPPGIVLRPERPDRIAKVEERVSMGPPASAGVTDGPPLLDNAHGSVAAQVRRQPCRLRISVGDD
jgi:hypothetical protein